MKPLQSPDMWHREKNHGKVRKMLRKIVLGMALAIGQPALAEAEPDGREIYERDCMECHMPDGSGEDPAPEVAGIPQNNLRRAMGGLEGMPEFEFSAEELAAILAYLQTLDD